MTQQELLAAQADYDRREVLHVAAAVDAAYVGIPAPVPMFNAAVWIITGVDALAAFRKEYKRP